MGRVCPWVMTMSWQNAKREAQKWVDRLELPQNLQGKVIYIYELAEKLPFDGKFRDMVVRASMRILKFRGATIRKDRIDGGPEQGDDRSGQAQTG